MHDGDRITPLDLEATPTDPDELLLWRSPDGRVEWSVRGPAGARVAVQVVEGSLGLVVRLPRISARI